jgi:hypothetical protein
MIFFIFNILTINFNSYTVFWKAGNYNKIRFFGGFADEKTPYRRAWRVRAPRGGDKILNFGDGDKCAHQL